MMRLGNSLGVVTLAASLAGCAVGGFDLTGSSSSPSPPVPANAEPSGVPGAIAAQPPHGGAPVHHTSAAPVQTQRTVHTAPSPPPVPPPAAQPTRQLPAARAARAPDIPPTPPPDAEPEMTIYRARELCWMSTEANKTTRTVDQKVQFVQKCVDEKMRAAAR